MGRRFNLHQRAGIGQAADDGSARRVRRMRERPVARVEARVRSPIGQDVRRVDDIILFYMIDMTRNTSRIFFRRHIH